MNVERVNQLADHLDNEVKDEEFDIRTHETCVIGVASRLFVGQEISHFNQLAETLGIRISGEEDTTYWKLRHFCMNWDMEPKDVTRHHAAEFLRSLVKA